MSRPIVLYQYPGGGGLPSLSGPCCKVVLALGAMGLEHDTVDLQSPMQVSRVSPSGRVPAIRIGDRVVADSTSLLDVLDELHPERSLRPADPARATVDRLWELTATDSLYWVFFYRRWLVPENRARLAGALGRNAVRRFLIRTVYPRLLVGRARGQGIGGRSPAEVFAALERHVELAAAGLAGGPFLQGRARPGRGDVALAGMLSQAGFVGAMPEEQALLERHPALLAHAARCFRAAGLEPPSWLRTAP